MPAAGTIGTLGRRIFDGPWDTSFDLSLLKRTRIIERHSIDLRMDVSNFFNHLHPTFLMRSDGDVLDLWQDHANEQRQPRVPVPAAVSLLRSGGRLEAPALGGVSLLAGFVGPYIRGRSGRLGGRTDPVPRFAQCHQ
jgi:hypothetical protein